MPSALSRAGATVEVTMLPDTVRLSCLLERLRELEKRQVLDHERPILEVSLASLRAAICELSHRLHDLDYWQRMEDGRNCDTD